MTYHQIHLKFSADHALSGWSVEPLDGYSLYRLDAERADGAEGLFERVEKLPRGATSMDVMTVFEGETIIPDTDLRALLSLARRPGVPEGWRCFHCDEIFTGAECAKEHFGAFQDCEPACKIGVERFRAMEEELQMWRSESDPSSKAFYELGAKHSQELMRANDKGFADGMRDAKALSALSEPEEGSR